MKNIEIRKILLKFGVGCLLLLSSCSQWDQSFQEANQHVDRTQKEMSQIRENDDRPVPTVVVRDGFYVDPKQVTLGRDPAWLNHPVQLQAQQMPFDQLIDQLLQGANVNARYNDNVHRQRLVNIHYRGTVKGALETIAKQTHYAYTLDNNTVTWSNFQTRTFNIAFMPGKSDYMVGKDSSGGTGGGGVQANGSNGNVQSSINDDQYSTLKGQLSIWDDLKYDLNKLKSEDGMVLVSEATTTVTVHDHPDNMVAIAKYIEQLNKNLSRQVAIKVEVLDITLNNDFNYGINWDAVLHTLGTDFTFGGALGQATNVDQTAALITGSTSGLSTLSIGDGQHQTLIQALSQQGKLNVVTRPRLVTMNNQIASIRITTDTAYVKNVSTTIVSEGGATSSIEPGTVTQGFTLYLLPKIYGRKVYLQISSTLTDLISIQKEDNVPQGVDLSKQTSTANTPYVAVDVPTLSQKVFNQRSVVTSGATLVIAGFKQLRNQTKQAKYFGIAPLGGEGSDTGNKETILLITPVILTP